MLTMRGVDVADDRVTVVVDRQLLADLAAVAAAVDRSRSGEIREALRSYIERHPPMDLPANDTQLSLLLPTDLLAQIDAVAAGEDRTRAALIRTALREHRELNRGEGDTDGA